MITEIKLHKISTYTEPVCINLKKYNFFFGANGTGKSTISKLLDGEISSLNCGLTWSGPDHEDIVVYNRSFINRNFSADSELQGIFTLGEDSIGLRQQIDDKQKQIDAFATEKGQKSTTLGNQENKRTQRRSEFENVCWEIQRKYGAEFADALVGYRGNRRAFCDNCLSVYKASSKQNEDEPVVQIDTLRSLYTTAFTKGLSVDTEYSLFDENPADELGSLALLEKVITGKNDTPVGQFIEYLQASDWVLQGVSYAKRANGKCPYCQRELPTDIEHSIEDFFDASYQRDCDTLRAFLQKFRNYRENFLDKSNQITGEKKEYIDYATFELAVSHVLEIIDKNIAEIEKKVEKPSVPVSIQPIAEDITAINTLLKQINTKIKEHNALVADQKTAQANCRTQIWLFFVQSLEREIDQFIQEDTGLEKGINALKTQISEKEKEIRILRTEIREAESRLTSVRPTVIAINDILKGFGFNGFMLAVNEQSLGTYKIVRCNGEDASKTLSEGEHNFLSFLYFYHLCFGSQDSANVTRNKILVIDDPISSMDNNVLFIVSTLVKAIIQNCRDGKNGIKQVLVLTHNVYFHKEITFWGNKQSLPTTETRYFIVRKKNEVSSVTGYESNQIRTSYEMLWEDLRNPTELSLSSAFNTMRRILEHYFNIVGGLNYEKCINELEGTDKIVCKALVAFINDGSHSVFEDLIFSVDDLGFDNYMRVFRLIFEKLNHIDHYNMMMKVPTETLRQS